VITRVDRARWQEAVKTSLEPTAECVGLLLSALDAADALRGALVSIRRQYPEHVQLHAFIDSEIAAYDAIVEPPRA